MHRMLAAFIHEACLQHATRACSSTTPFKRLGDSVGRLWVGGAAVAVSGGRTTTPRQYAILGIGHFFRSCCPQHLRLKPGDASQRSVFSKLLDAQHKSTDGSMSCCEGVPASSWMPLVAGHPQSWQRHFWGLLSFVISYLT